MCGTLISTSRATVWSAIVVGLTMCAISSRLSADVVIVANRTDQQVTFRTLGDAHAQQQEHQLAPWDQWVMVTRGRAELFYDFRGQLTRYQLDANAVYYFTTDDNGWRVLRKLALGGTPDSFRGRSLGEEHWPLPVVEIPVKVLVDDAEPATRKIWEPRVRSRLAAASDVLQQTVGVRLKVVAVDQWVSDPAVTELRSGLGEFQQLVDPEPGWLAIGFSSKFQPVPGKVHLGGARGLLHPHILISETSKAMSGPERLEVLLHELGHYLGATHSPDSMSVMRPILADRRAVRADFPIRYDAVNILIMHLVAEEIRARGVRSVSRISAGTRLRLREIYDAITSADAEDDSVRQLRLQLQMAPDAPLIIGVRQVVSAVRSAAGAVERRGKTGDALTDYYVRAAAQCATKLPPEIGPAATILGLGIAFDHTHQLRAHRFTRELCELVEAETDEHNVPSLGAVTVLGRSDLAQHFFLSAYLAVALNPSISEAAGLTKELLDSRTASGFSYADLAADLAGIAWSRRLLAGQLAVAEMAESDSLAWRMPPIDGLPEGVGWDQLKVQLEGAGDGSFPHYRREIDARIRRVYGDR